MKEKLLVICPGRGTYNAAELGYLARYHADRGTLIARLDALRAAQGQPSISELDGAETYRASLHMPGDNASLLIYACALADFAAIDRDRYRCCGSDRQFHGLVSGAGLCRHARF